ncbi:SAM-dependent methyltransferase [Nocardia brasiliensis]|uniref:SAM-dependent methyltransferase n=1 Tax=Nocardia brasiliensis TaxID=37326 RepID=UPI00367104F8
MGNLLRSAPSSATRRRRLANKRQFVDLGSGLPTADNVRPVAQRYATDATVAYVDNDPIVLAHGRALLATDHKTTVIQADLRDPRSIRENPRWSR